MKTSNQETSKIEVRTYDLSDCTTTSSKIRKLLAMNLSRSDVAKYLNVRYQHVRNVQITPIKKQLVRK